MTSAIPPMESQGTSIAPPPPPLVDFQNFSQFEMGPAQFPGGQAEMEGLAQFEPPSVMNNQAVAAAMMFQQ